MKKIEVDMDWYNSALKLAEYIDNDDSEYDSFQDFMADNNEPKDHIYYHAAIVGGWIDSLEYKHKTEP